MKHTHQRYNKDAFFPSSWSNIFFICIVYPNSLGRMFSGVNKLDWPTQTPHLNTFGMNWSSNCEPDPIGQHWCLTSLMWLNENKFPQVCSNILWKLFLEDKLTIYGLDFKTEWIASNSINLKTKRVTRWCWFWMVEKRLNWFKHDQIWKKKKHDKKKKKITS